MRFLNIGLMIVVLISGNACKQNRSHESKAAPAKSEEKNEVKKVPGENWEAVDLSKNKKSDSKSNGAIRPETKSDSSAQSNKALNNVDTSEHKQKPIITDNPEGRSSKVKPAVSSEPSVSASPASNNAVQPEVEKKEKEKSKEPNVENDKIKQDLKAFLNTKKEIDLVKVSEELDASGILVMSLEDMSYARLNDFVRDAIEPDSNLMSLIISLGKNEFLWVAGHPVGKSDVNIELLRDKSKSVIIGSMKVTRSKDSKFSAKISYEIQDEKGKINKIEKVLNEDDGVNRLPASSKKLPILKKVLK